jgi:hypothetical protein
VHGKLEMIHDEDLKKEILKKFKFLGIQSDHVGVDSMVVFRLSHGQATAWTLTTAFAEKKYLTF